MDHSVGHSEGSDIERLPSAEYQRVCELIAGRLLSAEECVSPPEAALRVAVKEGRFSFDAPWMRPEDARFDESLKDVVRRLLGMTTSWDRRHARKLRVARWRRAREIRLAARGKLCGDPRAWMIVAAGSPKEPGVAHARRLLHARAISDHTRRARNLGSRPRGRTGARRPRGRSRRRCGPRSTRAGPDDGSGEEPSHPLVGALPTGSARR